MATLHEDPGEHGRVVLVKGAVERVTPLCGAAMSPDGTDGPQLRTSWRWSDVLSGADDVDRLAELWRQAVTVLGEAL